MRASRLASVVVSTLLGAGLISACNTSIEDAPRDRAESQMTDRSGATGTGFYRVTRKDLRKCMHPMCGGWFIERVNHPTTVCADGSEAPECYVSSLDLSGLLMNDADREALSAAAKNGRALLRGNLVDEDFGRLVATEGWQGQAASLPSGVFFGVKSSGIVCITHPCPTITQFKINELDVTNAHGVDLTQTVAPQDSVDAGHSALGAGDVVIVAGVHETITGPAGDGINLVASEFYLRVDKEPAPVTCGNNTCGAGEYCCNSSCGICAPEGGFCIQIACAPEPDPDPAPSCQHSECDKGKKLETGCSSCATTVCEVDAYCCSVQWDSICVGEAEELCADTCEAPAGCAHSECKTGVKLDATCSDCASTVCGVDPYCCDHAWDSICKQEAKQLCASCQ